MPSPAQPESLAAVRLADAVAAVRRAASSYAASRYPQVAAVLAQAADDLEAVADEGVSQQLRQLTASRDALLRVTGRPSAWP